VDDNRRGTAMDAGNLVLGVAVSQDGRWVVSEWNEDAVHRKRSIVIDLYLLYVDRTDAVYQVIQRSLLGDPNHDQTICRNPSILYA